MLSQVLKAGSRNNESTHFSLYREPTHRFFCVSTWRLNKIYICVQVLCCSLNNRVCVYLQLIYILAAEAARKLLPVNWRSVRRLYKGLIKARICGFFFLSIFTSCAVCDPQHEGKSNHFKDFLIFYKLLLIPYQGHWRC